MWRKWIKKQGIQIVADKLGVSYECVRAWVNNGRVPKDTLKKKLVRLSRGEFGYGDFYRGR